MSAPPGRSRRREDDGSEGAAHDQRTAAAAQMQSADRAVSDAQGEIEVDPSAADAQPQLVPTTAVQPLPEQFKHVQGPLSGRSFHSLATVELQLCLQFMDSKSKLKAARCSRRLLNAASAPFAWSAAVAVTVTVRSAADVEQIQTSLLRFAPVQLRCTQMEPLQCILTVPHLFGLELRHLPALVVEADLLQLLRHPNLARLQTLRLDDDSCRLVTVDTTRLVARLPQLRTFGMTVPSVVSRADLLRPLSGAPVLTDLSVAFEDWVAPDTAHINAVGACAQLRSLSLRCLTFPSGAFLALCSSPAVRQLRHLELADCDVTSERADDAEPSGANEYQASFGALEQLQSLTLDNVWGINRLLPHLHRAPTVRLLSIRCKSELMGSDPANCPLPSRDVLRALPTAAPQLEVRLLLPATLDGWLESYRAIIGESIEQQWRELQRTAAELERVTVVEE